MTTDKSKNFFRVSAEDFKKIPSSPLAYDISDQIRYIFFTFITLSAIASPRKGMVTADNPRFIRAWSEIALNKIGVNLKSRDSAAKSTKKWFPYMKGGTFRRWYGNQDFVVNWENDGYQLLHMQEEGYKVGSTNHNLEYIFKPATTWTKISSGIIGFRFNDCGFLYDDASGLCPAIKDCDNYFILGLLNTPICLFIINKINPTINLNPGNLASLPVCCKMSKVTDIVHDLTIISKKDWDSYETSWDFQMNPLCVSPQERAEQLSYGIHSEERAKAVSLISERYMRLRCDWQRQTEEMRELEIENNRIFIDEYGLQDELSPEVPWNEITLTCNPWYRYGKKTEDMDRLGNSLYMNISEGKVMPTSKQEEDCPAGDFPFAAETEQRLLEDTIKEFISYAVGCMMGRYSPEKPGLILANQSKGQEEDLIAYETTVTGSNIFSADPAASITFEAHAGQPHLTSSYANFYPTIGDDKHFIMDRDGVLPILEEEWFFDDVVTQFRAFVALTFGEESLADNMAFIEAVLGKDIRKYFVKDFYKEHIQRYKKRPIYWLFSSPKGSFNALIYLHRYTPDTVSIVLNEYLRELMTKISTRIKHLIEENNRTDISNADKTRNLKQIDKYTAQLAELEDYERDVIFPLAQQKIAIDLDDGVKVNYCKFGAALKKIPGLEAKEE